MTSINIQENEKYNGKPILPALKWAGGKRKVADIVIDLYRENNCQRVIEPFAGGMAVSLAIRPEEAIVNDINPHVINFYRQVKNGLKITIRMEYDKELYYSYRKLFNENIKKGEINTPEMAQLFYYLNKTGFNGMCRFNKKGFLNVPFGTFTKVNYKYDFMTMKRQFKKWDILCGDFSLIESKESDFNFIDSPYVKSFSSYSEEGFNWDDQIRNAEHASKAKGPVLMTNLATPEIIELYESYGFNVRVIRAPRTISSKGGERKPVWEVMAYKNMKITNLFMERTHDYKEVLEEY